MFKFQESHMHFCKQFYVKYSNHFYPKSNWNMLKQVRKWQSSAFTHNLNWPFIHFNSESFNYKITYSVTVNTIKCSFFFFINVDIYVYVVYVYIVYVGFLLCGRGNTQTGFLFCNQWQLNAYVYTVIATGTRRNVS